jgi:hypothetical protein
MRESRPMSVAVPITMFCVVGALWAATAIVNSRLLALFLQQTTDDADLPPQLREPGRHPEKLFYFFRSTTTARLQAIPSLWRLRQTLATLLWLSVIAPVVGFALVLLIALLLAS